MPETPSRRRRGQQAGRPGPARRLHEALPVVEETLVLAPAQQHCPHCGGRFLPIARSEDSELLEIEVKGYRRRLKRQCYRRSCDCEQTALFPVAPVAPKLLPKSKIGISLWVFLLIGKYGEGIPLARQLPLLASAGLSLSPATLVDGFGRLALLLLPCYEALLERQQQQPRWHADETRWEVFEPVEGKANSRWYLWVICSAEVVTYLLEPSRAAQVIQALFDEQTQGLLSVDRYPAYKKLAKHSHIVLAFCWAHVRRDFLNAAVAHPASRPWALEWVQHIATLYQHHQLRQQAAPASLEFQQADAALHQHLQNLEQLAQRQIQQATLPQTQAAVLKSLLNHWQGLTVFLKHPQLPLDNNTAERALRGAVVGRKNYYGSGSQASAALAAILFSLIQTLRLHHLDPRAWLTQYFQACAQAGGSIPDHWQTFLPWNRNSTPVKPFTTQSLNHDTT